jgi:hypothetical protein
MDAASTSLEQHGCGIHAVCFGTGDTVVTEVRFQVGPAALARENPASKPFDLVRAVPQ